MEREFGEKSFRPAPFEFMTIFSGSFNREYQNLFSRKLPGQILLSAYYTPMTIRELAIELGVGSVYLEDEIAMLEKYNLIIKTSSAGKYQTNLVIFTESFTKEFYRQAEKFSISALNQIIISIRGKLLQIRELNVFCRGLSDNRLLWGVLWPVMRQGFEKFESKYPTFQERDKLYDGATGTKYGISYDEEETEYSCGTFTEYRCDTFAGFAKIDDDYYASAADFGVLADRNKYFINQDSTAFREKIHRIVSGNMEPEFMILSEADERKLYEILSEEAVLMAELYNQLFSCTCQSLRIHAPASVSGQIERIAFQTLFFRTVGLIGGCAVKSGELPLPDFDGPAAIYVRENTKEAEAGAKRNVLI